MVDSFAKLSPTETPKYLSTDFDDKINLLKRETNYLLGKVQRFVPKPKTTTTTPKVPVKNETNAEEEPTTTTPPAEGEAEAEEATTTPSPPTTEGQFVCLRTLVHADRLCFQKIIQTCEREHRQWKHSVHHSMLR